MTATRREEGRREEISPAFLICRQRLGFARGALGGRIGL